MKTKSKPKKKPQPKPTAAPEAKQELPFGSYEVHRAECPFCHQADRTAEITYELPSSRPSAYGCGRCQWTFPAAGARIITTVETLSDEDRAYLAHETMGWL